MLEFNGSKIKLDFAMFMSKKTGQSLEAWHMEIFKPKIETWNRCSSGSLTNSKTEPIKLFDYRDLAKEGKFKPMIRPSKDDVGEFMVQKGHTFESAHIKLNAPKIDSFFVGGKFHKL